MTFIFLMDPLETVKMEKDTSFILMFGAYTRGHEVYFLPDGGTIRGRDGLRFHAERVVPRKDASSPFARKGAVTLTQADVDAVFIRNDPPFDAQYLMNTWLLDHLPATVPVINHPAGIRTVNEKVWATQFTDLIPETLVGRDKKDLIGFIKTHKEAIAKPTDAFGGQSVFHIHQNSRNTNVILETLTKNWQKDIILQEYIPEAANGDKRILLLNGEPLGAVLRMHAEDDHRNNFLAGGSPQPAEVTARDREIIAVLKPHFQKLGLYFVGIDILGGCLIEVNVTSPTCLQEMSRFAGAALEDKVIDFAENLVDQKKRAPVRRTP